MPRFYVRGWVFSVLFLCLSTLLGAQIVVRTGPRDTPPPTPPAERRIPVGTSAISGTITASDTGWPLANVRVGLNGQATVADGVRSDGLELWLSRMVVTDASGQFSFPQLPAGVFRINAWVSQSQYLSKN